MCVCVCLCVCLCVHVHVRGESSREGEVEVGLWKLFKCSWRFVAEGDCLDTRHLVSWLLINILIFSKTYFPVLCYSWYSWVWLIYSLVNSSTSCFKYEELMVTRKKDSCLTACDVGINQGPNLPYIFQLIFMTPPFLTFSDNCYP